MHTGVLTFVFAVQLLQPAAAMYKQVQLDSMLHASISAV